MAHLRSAGPIAVADGAAGPIAVADGAAGPIAVADGAAGDGATHRHSCTQQVLVSHVCVNHCNGGLPGNQAPGSRHVWLQSFGAPATHRRHIDCCAGVQQQNDCPQCSVRPRMRLRHSQDQYVMSCSAGNQLLSTPAAGIQASSVRPSCSLAATQCLSGRQVPVTRVCRRSSLLSGCRWAKVSPDEPSMTSSVRVVMLPMAWRTAGAV
jgi:hypothetical protein